MNLEAQDSQIWSKFAGGNKSQIKVWALLKSLSKQQRSENDALLPPKVIYNPNQGF